MKKIISLALTIILLMSSLLVLSACGQNNGGDEESGPIKISVLNGTTGFGIAQLMSLNEQNLATNKYEINVETNASFVTSALIAGTIDMAALPTNAASTVYNATNGGVQIIAINTLGVLYLLEKGQTVTNLEDLNGKTVYVPAQNPTFIAKYIFNYPELQGVTLDSTTYSTPEALKNAVIAGVVDYAILPQPIVTAVTSANKEYRVAFDLTQEWNKIEGAGQLVQGCVVARTEFLNNNKEAVDAFLSEYEASINYLSTNVDDAAKLIVKYGIFANENIAKKAIPECNVIFMKGDEMKSAMSAFLDVMYSVAPQSIGNALPNNDFYYIP